VTVTKVPQSTGETKQQQVLALAEVVWVVMNSSKSTGYDRNSMVCGLTAQSAVTAMAMVGGNSQSAATKAEKQQQSTASGKKEAVTAVGQ